VPFCASKCIYCDFTVVLAKHAPKHGGIEAFEAAPFAELDQRLAALPDNITLRLNQAYWAISSSILQAFIGA
jgi:coproporphyrinogen III oxidase-like Fe-S oxidoreductase